MKRLIVIGIFMLSACSVNSIAEVETPSPSHTTIPTTTVTETIHPTSTSTLQPIKFNKSWALKAMQENGVWDIYLQSPDGAQTLKAGLSKFDPGDPVWYGLSDYQIFIFKSYSDGNQYKVDVSCITLQEGCSPYVEVYRELDPAPQPGSTFTPEPTPALIPENENIGWIAFSTWANEAHETTDLFLLSPDGNHLKPFGLSDYSPQQPAWSYDGQKIAFEGDGNIYQVYVGCVDLPEGCLPYVSRLTTAANDEGFHWPAWSSDGTKLAYIYEEPNRDADLHAKVGIFDLQTDSMEIISELGWKPLWSLGQDAIAVMDHGSKANLELISLQDLETQTMISGNIINLDWAWSPDQSKVLYLSGAQTDPEIYLHDLDTNESEFVINGSNPVWSPTGTLIAYYDFRLKEIHVYDLESGIDRLLHKAPVFELAWSP